MDPLILIVMMIGERTLQLCWVRRSWRIVYVSSLWVVVASGNLLL